LAPLQPGLNSLTVGISIQQRLETQGANCKQKNQQRDLGPVENTPYINLFEARCSLDIDERDSHTQSVEHGY
jgi:hypothetical protein